jgi:DNA-binding MarR family transcriptional regulator
MASPKKHKHAGFEPPAKVREKAAASEGWKDQVYDFNEVYLIAQNTPDLEALPPEEAAPLLRDLRSALMGLEHLETEVLDLPVLPSKTDPKSFMFMDRTLQNMFNSIRSGNPYKGVDLWGDWRQVQAWLVSVVRRFQKDLLPELAVLGQASSFTWNGLRVENEDGLPAQTVKAMLDGMSEGLAVLRRRGLNKLVAQSLKRIVFHTDSSNFPNDSIPKDRVGGWYSPKSKSLHLLAKELDPNRASRLISRWFTEVFLHEFGHHIHLSVLSPAARANWDDAWDYLDKVRLEVLSRSSVDSKDVNTFMNAQWDGARYLDWAAAGRNLKGLERGKFLFTLHHAGWSKSPTRVTVTDSGKKLLEALRWESVLKGSTGPGAKAKVPPAKAVPEVIKAWLAALREIGYPLLRELPSSVRDGLRDGHISPEARQDLEDWMNAIWAPKTRGGDIAAKHWLSGMLNSTYQEMPEEVWKYLDKTDPGIRSQVDDIMNAMGLPTEYAKTNEKEDFAETFVLWVAAPDQLSPAQRWRMGRSLGLSAAGGKPVFDRLGKLSTHLAVAFVKARLTLRNSNHAQR